jgi:hypothetical protein
MHCSNEGLVLSTLDRLLPESLLDPQAVSLCLCMWCWGVQDSPKVVTLVGCLAGKLPLFVGALSQDAALYTLDCWCGLARCICTARLSQRLN